MSVTFGFYNALNHDRTYDAVQMSSIFDGIIKDGIFMSIGTALAVTAGTGLQINVGIGRAWFNHTWTLNDAILPLYVQEAELVLDRIDSVILEVDSSEEVRANSIKIVKGVPGSVPEHQEMVNTETKHQYRLADIHVEAGTEEITQSDITNFIGTENTPFITGVLETISADMLLAQWQAEFEELYDDVHEQCTQLISDVESELGGFEERFESWFQHLQDELDDNQAAHLQRQIDDIYEMSNAEVDALF